MINGSKDSFFTTDYTDFHRLFIGIAILSVLICVICGEKAEYGCHNYISGCFFPDAFKRESHDKSAIITALIGYGGGCVADGIGHDWKSGRHGQDAIRGSDRIALLIRQAGKGEGMPQSPDSDFVPVCFQRVAMPVLQDILNKFFIALRAVHIGAYLGTADQEMTSRLAIGSQYALHGRGECFVVGIACRIAGIVFFLKSEDIVHYRIILQ